MLTQLSQNTDLHDFDKYGLNTCDTMVVFVVGSGQSTTWTFESIFDANIMHIFPVILLITGLTIYHANFIKIKSNTFIRKNTTDIELGHIT